MGLIFAGDWARWLTFACVFILVLALLAMPKAERRRFFRTIREQSRARRPGRTTRSASVESRHERLGSPRPYVDPESDLMAGRTLSRVRSAALVIQFFLALIAIGGILLFIWMVFTFLTNLPG